jgi:hypothetical protein
MLFLLFPKTAGPRRELTGWPFFSTPTTKQLSSIERRTQDSSRRIPTRSPTQSRSSTAKSGSKPKWFFSQVSQIPVHEAQMMLSPPGFEPSLIDLGVNSQIVAKGAIKLSSKVAILICWRGVFSARI